MIPDSVWSILEEQQVVPAPKLPQVGKVVEKARERQCSVQLNYPADPDEEVMAIVSRQGQRFTGEALKDVEAVALALADCLVNTEPQQLDFFEDEESSRTKPKSVFDEVEEHLAAVGEDGEDEDAEEDEGDEAEVTEADPSDDELEDEEE